MCEKKPDIIYFTLFPWNHPYSSVSLSLTKAFAKNTRVFYINHPTSLKDFIKGFHKPNIYRRRKGLLKGKMQYESIPGLSKNVVAIHPPLTLPINGLPEGKLYNYLNRLNSSIIQKTIKNVIADYQLKDFIFLNCFNPFFSGNNPRLRGAKLNIYQCIDDVSQVSYTARHGIRLEKNILQKVDIVFVTSKQLQRLKSPFNKCTFLLNNAADIQIFKKVLQNQYPKPLELSTIYKKVIGFIGNLDEHRINYPLLKKLAESYPFFQVLLIGPINNRTYKTIGLDKLPNVTFTGSKMVEDLPAYLQYMDCTIIPFHSNRLTQSIYPIKINEYLAAGKAVVSTNFSEDIQTFKDYIYLAKNERHFLELIEIAIQENCNKKIKQRVELAEKNSWDARAKEFWAIVNSKIKATS